ncbi:MAG: NblA/ycf18 family protein [Leptolyngbyaceae cyanobacterium]
MSREKRFLLFCLSCFSDEVCDMDMPGELTLEQKFQLQVLKEQVRNLSREDAQNYVLKIMQQMMVKDNLVKHLLKNA